GAPFHDSLQLTSFIHFRHSSVGNELSTEPSKFRNAALCGHLLSKADQNLGIAFNVVGLWRLSMLIWWLIILPGFARPLTIKSRRYSLYFFTGSCPVPMVNPFSKKLARGNEKIPCFRCSSFAPESGQM